MSWRLSGELAEMVVYQGPVLDTDMELGATGFWNNTMRPGVYYLKDQNGYFDATRAEIVGDIDGKRLCKQSTSLYYSKVLLSQLPALLPLDS